MLIGAEMKKLWPFEDNCTKLSEKFAAAKSAYENFARCFVAAKPPASTCVPLHNSNSIFAPCESPCEMDTSNLRNPPVYSQIFATNSVRFFLKIFCVNFYFLLVIN